MVCNRFLEYLNEKGHDDFSNLTLKEVSEFIPFISAWYQPSSMGVVLTALRSLFVFLSEQQLTSINMIPSLPGTSAKKTIVVPALTIEEEQQLLAAIDRRTQVGRDFALILLALRTGLRSIDIINLRLDSIDRI
jgi:site-specific recombinase XerD